MNNVSNNVPCRYVTLKIYKKFYKNLSTRDLNYSYLNSLFNEESLNIDECIDETLTKNILLKERKKKKYRMTKKFIVKFYIILFNPK